MLSTPGVLPFISINADSKEGTRGVVALVPQNNSVASSPHKMSLRVKDLPNWFTWHRLHKLNKPPLETFS